MRKLSFFLVSLLVVVGILLTGCGQAPAPTSKPAAEPTKAEEVKAEPTKAAEVKAEPTKAEATSKEGKIKIRWFVGLGAGGDPPQVEAQNAIVKKFNESQDKIELVIELVSNAAAYDTLSTEVAGGDPPDLVGPVGVRGSNAFSGLFMDLEPMVKKMNYDLSKYDPALVNFYRVPGEGLIGLPFAAFPSFLFYNRDIFDEAKMKYPPDDYGKPYADGKEWTVEKMAELAMTLTVDKNGKDANSPDFDPKNIVQFGYHPQFTDARGEATLFGAARFVDDSGKAVIPDNWRTAFKFYNDGIWNKHFMPNDAQVQSDLLAAGNPFSSGNVGMSIVHLWYTCCLGEVKNWDIAATPTYNGKVTAKLHADTFRILKGSKHPEEAFTVLSYLLKDEAPTLRNIYGGMPVLAEEQPAFFKALDEKFPQKVNWNIAIKSLAYPDNPSHESNMPNFQKADERVKVFYTTYRGTPGVDIDKELESLKNDLQVIYDAKK